MNDLRTCGKCHVAMLESFFSKHRSKFNKTCDACLSLPAKVKVKKPKKPKKTKPAIEPAMPAKPLKPAIEPAMPAKPLKPAMAKERSDLILYISETLNQTAKATRKTVLALILRDPSTLDKIKSTGDGTSLPFSILSDQTLYAIKELIEADPSFTNDDLPFGS
jgi:hypothetical protein